ncbi:MAG: hypothetical protein CMQ44_02780 [Gammaproteobacteria bacterium]|nr:hypothetical protein [Gammaproteobacteria bacterium]
MRPPYYDAFLTIANISQLGAQYTASPAAAQLHHLTEAGLRHRQNLDDPIARPEKSPIIAR